MNKYYKCALCKEKRAIVEGCICQNCGDDLTESSLIDMYGEEDGAYFAAIDYFPGDN